MPKRTGLLKRNSKQSRRRVLLHPAWLIALLPFLVLQFFWVLETRRPSTSIYKPFTTSAFEVISPWHPRPRMVNNLSSFFVIWDEELTSVTHVGGEPPSPFPVTEQTGHVYFTSDYDSGQSTYAQTRVRKIVNLKYRHPPIASGHSNNQLTVSSYELGIDILAEAFRTGMEEARLPVPDDLVQKLTDASLADNTSIRISSESTGPFLLSGGLHNLAALLGWPWAFLLLVRFAKSRPIHTVRVHTRRFRIARANLCPRCGYSRIGLGANDACPECAHRPWVRSSEQPSPP